MQADYVLPSGDSPAVDLGGNGGKRRAPSRRPPAPRREQAGDLQEVPVLVVDDDAASGKLVGVALGLEGCDVRIAASAEEALAMLRTFRPRVMVIDLILPLMSGLLLAQRLKADDATSDIVLIAVTAFNGAEAERVAREVGIAAYVRKPIDPLTFTQVVADALRGEK